MLGAAITFATVLAGAFALASLSHDIRAMVAFARRAAEELDHG